MRAILYLLFFLLPYCGLSQSFKEFTYTAETGGLYSINNKIPFWLKSNQFGVFPDSGNTVFFIQSLHTKKDTTGKFFSVNAGIELASIVGGQVRLLLPEAYLGFKVGKVNFMMGRKKQIHGFTDTTLTSGSITWSGNALPIPEVQVSIPDYINVFNSWIGFKGHFSHGWFGNQPYVKGYYLHQKSLYGRIGKPNGKIKLYGGILHHAQWGGQPKYDISEDNWLKVGDRFAEGWNVYRDVVFPFSNPPADSAKVGSFDFENRYGNHLGQVDIGGELDTRRFRLLFYKQLPFETGQTFSSLGNLDDGVYGISVVFKEKFSLVRRIVVEFIHTTNQGMYRSGLLRLLGINGRHYGRNQNYYFNHSQYIDGWSYEGNTIGTPFMLPNPEIRNEKSEDFRHYFANNNNIKGGYIGAIFKASDVIIESRLSYSRNFGTFDRSLPNVSQMSFASKICIPVDYLKGMVNLNVGIEQGDLIRDNFGVMLSYKRVWQ